MQPDRELMSWKEIADHLGITVRTAQRWESERGMPVKRLPGGRGLVAASIDELAAWKNKTDIQPPARRAWASVIGVGTLGILAVALPGWFPFRGSLAVVRPEGSALVAYDVRGNELWRSQFSNELPKSDYDFESLIWHGDLNGDGEPEVLFGRILPGLSNEGSILYCFNSKGGEMWRFVPGRKVATRKEEFSNTYRIRNVSVGAWGIFVAASHGPYYPSQLALLSTTGHFVGEYWHSGHLSSFASGNYAAHPALFVGGVSNSYNAATLLVLDRQSFDGGVSDESAHPDYQILGLTPGRERARLIFPRTCVNLKFEQHNSVNDLALRPEMIDLFVGERHFNTGALGVLFHFAPDLSLRNHQWAGDFKSLHSQLRAAGQLDHDLTGAEQEASSHVVYLKR